MMMDVDADQAQPIGDSVVVDEFAEAEGGASKVFESAVDGYGRSVGGAWSGRSRPGHRWRARSAFLRLNDKQREGTVERLGTTRCEFVFETTWQTPLVL